MISPVSGSATVYSATPSAPKPAAAAPAATAPAEDTVHLSHAAQTAAAGDVDHDGDSH